LSTFFSPVVVTRRSRDGNIYRMTFKVKADGALIGHDGRR
jgi:hypothetical protein